MSPAPVGRTASILRPRRSKSQSFRDDAFDDPSPYAVHRARLLIYELLVRYQPVSGVQYLPVLVQSRSLLVLNSKLTLEQRTTAPRRRYVVRRRRLLQPLNS